MLDCLVHAPDDVDDDPMPRLWNLSSLQRLTEGRVYHT